MSSKLNRPHGIRCSLTLHDRYAPGLVIRETSPDSMAVLAKTTGRRPSNLSRTLKTMARYGLVDLQRHKTVVRPVVTATELRILAEA